MKISTLLKIIEEQESARLKRLKLMHQIIIKEHGHKKIDHEFHARKGETAIMQNPGKFIKNQFNEFDLAHMTLLKTI